MSAIVHHLLRSAGTTFITLLVLLFPGFSSLRTLGYVYACIGGLLLALAAHFPPHDA